LIDPSTHPNNDQHLRKGQLVRVQALVGGFWNNVFSGTIKAVDTTFISTATAVNGSRLVTFTAHDHIHRRKQKPHSHGVGKSDDLRAYIDGPYNINGLTTSKSSVGVNTFEHDNTSEWDQILITRDTEQSFAWVDKNDIFQMHVRANQSTVTRATISATDYSKVDLNYTIENIINEVVVKEIKKYANGKTHVVHKGVWTDDPSITKNGRFKAVYTVQDHLATWADDAAFANNILAKNSDPEIVPVGCSIPITTTGDIAAFLDPIDLMDKVNIIVDGITYACRVNSITVETDGTILLMSMTFTHQDIVYKPHVKPGTGIGNVTDNQVETSHINDFAVTSGKLADGAVTSTKVAFTVNDIGGSKFTASATAPSSPTTGDWWVDTTNGNILKRWTGSAWVSAQDAAIATAQAAATTAQATANGKNKVTYSTSTPGTTANTAGDIWFQQTSGIITGQWTGNGGTSWTAVTVGNTVIANLDAGKITTGILAAARIGAGSITADRLSVVIGGGNLVSNSSFETDMDPFTVNPDAGWSATFGSRAAATYDTVNFFMGTRSVKISPATNGDATALVFPPFAVLAGEKYTVSAYVKVLSGTDTPATMNISANTPTYIVTNPATNTALTTTRTAIGTSGWYRLSNTFTFTTSGTFRPGIFNTNSTTANDTTLVVDAVQVERSDIVSAYSPKADEILPGTIVASMIAAGTITADLIAANAIVASKIAAGAIDGKVITGATIQTATSGDRTVLSPSSTAKDIKFYSAAGSGDPGYVGSSTSFAGDIGGGKNQYESKVTLASEPAQQQNTSDARVELHSQSTYTRGNPITGLVTDNWIQMVGRIVSDYTYGATAASSANVFMFGDHSFGRSTSLRKAKIKIQPMKKEEYQNLLSIEPVSFYDKGEWNRNGKKSDGLRRIPGAIAEQVEQVAPLFATYDNDGLNGIAYDRIGVSLIPIVKALLSRVEKLETQLTK
jgi:hypothetical protein